MSYNAVPYQYGLMNGCCPCATPCQLPLPESAKLAPLLVMPQGTVKSTIQSSPMECYASCLNTGLHPDNCKKACVGYGAGIESRRMRGSGAGKVE